jgi:tetratricopeptide (TPR) repeat protein
MNITRSVLCTIAMLLCSCGPSTVTGAGPQDQNATVEIPTEKPTSEARPPDPDPPAPRGSSAAAPRSADTPAPPPGDSQRAAAQATFDHARELMAQGKLVEACIKFEESVGLDPAVGSWLNLGACEERLGRTPQACRAFFEAASLAARNGQREREAFARSRMTNLGCPP